LAEPTQNEINGLYPGLGKFVEIGTLYTTVAGLLNVLAIYDAFEGPAHADEAEPAPLDTRVSTGKPIVIDVEARA
jgi:hypothetical protein